MVPIVDSGYIIHPVSGSVVISTRRLVYATAGDLELSFSSVHVWPL